MGKVRGKWYERQVLNWRWWLVMPVAMLAFIPAAMIVAARLLGSAAEAAEEPLLGAMRAMRMWCFRAVDARIRARHAPTPATHGEG